MATNQANSAVATAADWKLAEATWDVFEPLLSRKPTVAAAMAEEIYQIAQRYAAQHLTPQRAVTTPLVATVATETR